MASLIKHIDKKDIETLIKNVCKVLNVTLKEDRKTQIEKCAKVYLIKRMLAVNYNIPFIASILNIHTSTCSRYNNFVSIDKKVYADCKRKIEKFLESEENRKYSYIPDLNNGFTEEQYKVLSNMEIYKKSVNHFIGKIASVNKRILTTKKPFNVSLYKKDVLHMRIDITMNNKLFENDYTIPKFLTEKILYID